MFTIVVDGLRIRLPDSQSTFNPRYAFSCKGGNSLGLRVVESGHLLLPIDAEGSIAVSPGENYELVCLIEKRKNLLTDLPEGSSLNNKAVNLGETTSQITKLNTTKKDSVPQQNKKKKVPENVLKNHIPKTSSSNTTHSKEQEQLRFQAVQGEGVEREKVSEKNLLHERMDVKKEGSQLENLLAAGQEAHEEHANAPKEDKIESSKSLDVVFESLVRKSTQLKKPREYESPEPPKRSRKHPLEDSSDSD